MNQPAFSIPAKLKLLQNKLLKLRQSEKLFLQNGDVGYGKAPSNIALIKYWGKSKTHFQYPDNSSISFTLNNFFADTSITVIGRFYPQGETPAYKLKHQFCLSDTESNQTTTNIPKKLQTFLDNILSPFASDIALKIESKNNFPTACGLASSAAGMAAICFALDDLLNLKSHFTHAQRQYWLSQWARLGSGSALRSTSLDKNGKFVAWEQNSNHQSRIKNLDYHKNWDDLKHCVFVIDTQEKQISSSEGHLFADTSPFHQIRVNLVNENYEKFTKALKDFDFKFVSNFTEQDALNMHATMQTCTPSAKYLTQKTSILISEFLAFRAKTKFQGFWTLDAGPNLHILYFEKHENLLRKFHKYASKLLNQKIKIYE